MMEAQEVRLMVRGIAIIGPNGSGKSTLNHLLCKALGYYEMDSEDYYFPGQKAGRLWLQEHGGAQPGEELPAPYAVSCTGADAAMLRDMEIHPRFVLSCVHLHGNEQMIRRIEVAFCLDAPLETRLARIRHREEKRFGVRALPGGDLYPQQEAFRDKVKRSALKPADTSCLRCPVIRLDGTQSPEDNLRLMLLELQQR